VVKNANTNPLASSLRRHTSVGSSVLFFAVGVLTLLALSPGAVAFETRTPLEFFGPEGPGSCTDLSQATGTGDLSAAVGTGDTTILARAVGDITGGTTTVTGLREVVGTFTVGESISSSVHPVGTTITGVEPTTLTVSQPASGSPGAGAPLISGSKTISNVNTEAGSFEVGWTISGDGIPTGTTITAVGATSLTLSNGVTAGVTGQKITAGSTDVTNVATGCGAFAKGQTLVGAGIPSNTMVTAVDNVAGTLTLSKAPAMPGTGVELTGVSLFSGATDLAFNEASDTLYATDFPNDGRTIHAFNAPANSPAGGTFPKTIGMLLAVDDSAGASSGNIYMAGSSNLFGYDSAGAPLAGFPAFVGNGTDGVAVDSTGAIWTTSDLSDSDFLSKFDANGQKLAEISFSVGGPRTLAFGPSDDLYVAVQSSAAGKSGIWRFTAATNYTSGTQVVSSSTPDDLAVDRSTGTIYAVQGGGTNAYDSSGNLLHQFGIAGGSPNAVAVDESNDRVYVVERAARVRVYGTLGEFPDATAIPQSATSVTTTTADLHATLDDNSDLPTFWRFQVSKDGGTTWIEPCFSFNVTEGDQNDLALSCAAKNLQSGTDYLFRVLTNKGAGSTDVASGTEAFQTIALPPASASCESPASNLTAISADLSCTIDDNNAFPTNWRFQLSKDGGTTWADTDVSGVTAGSQSGVVASGTVADLDPNTEYLFRLVTSKGPGAVDTNFEGSAPFITLLAPPVLSGVGAYGLTDTSAHLTGEVNPRNDLTSYEFKYGTAPGSLTSSTPATGIGTSLEPIAVAQPIAGLSPDTDYFFKLVATNGAGSVESGVEALHTRAEPLPDDHPGDCANEGLREAQGSVHLPDCRAYEMVTPPEKNFTDLGVNGVVTASDGEAVSFPTVGGFGDPPGQVGFQATSYLSRRDTGAWRTRWPNEPGCFQSGSLTRPAAHSANFDLLVIPHPEPAGCQFPPLDPAAGTGVNYYAVDYRAEPPNYRLLPGVTTVSGVQIADSADHVVYTSTAELTPEAPVANFAKLYDWHDGDVSLLSKDTTNVPFATASSLAAGSPSSNPVSASGARVFFENGGEIYMRQLRAITYHVSQSECTSSCGAGSADDFDRATPDGSKVLIASAAKLTNDDSSPEQDLYLYTHSGNPAANVNLTLISKDSEPADGNSAGLLGVVGMSDDGKTVYFAASGQLVSGAPTEPGPKIYRWRASGGSPSLDYLATPAGADPPANSQWGNDSRRITPDGAYLFLHTTSRLVPGADHDADRDLYRWGDPEGWVCISCQLPGTPSAGDSPTLAFAGQPVAFSDDGQRAFFDSADALVPTDANGGVTDVYQWHDGSLSLISPGIGTGDSELLGAGRSGEDVFLRTRERLVGWDVDGNTDIYDARVAGGFAEPPPAPAPCEGDACRGQGTAAPAQVGAGSAAFQGPGDPVSEKPKSKRCPKGKRKVRRRGNARCVKRGRRTDRRHEKEHRRSAKYDRRAAR
jgi:hypothetical protein